MIINIKKIIDIILISAAIAAVVVFADRIIPSRGITAGQEAEGAGIEETSDRDDGTQKSVKEIRTDMVIDESLFMPLKNIFAAAPPAGAGEDMEVTVKEGSEPGSTAREAAVESRDSEGLADETEDANMEETSGGGPAEEAREDNNDYSKSEDFRIEVDLERQRVTVFYNNAVLKEMVCSGGALESPTPPGEYVTSQKIEYAWIERFDVGAYYWIRFFEDYLIHSVPFDENGDMIIEEYEKLGSPASHGCIRLRVEEAKWLYETLPLGVKVVIY